MAPTEPTTDDKLDALLGAVGALVTTVGSLAESVAQLADPGSGPAPEPLPLPEFTLESGYAELVPLDSTNVERRTRLAADLVILADVSGAELIRWGARGFYRRLERDEGQERLTIRHDLAVRLVQDAELEDVAEAQAMGRDLLARWDPDEEATTTRNGPLI